MSKTIRIKSFNLHPGQKKVYDAICKYENDGFHEHCLNAPRQWGKSTLALQLIIRYSIVYKLNGWMVFHYYSAAKDFFLTKLKPLLRKYPQIISSSNETELRITFSTGGQIQLKSSDNYAGMRTATLDYCVMDEFAFQKSEVYSEIISPMLMRRGRFALFISTPNGKNHFYDKYLQGLNPDFPTIHSYSSNIEETEDEQMIKNVYEQKLKIDDLTFRQEYMAEFLDDAGYVFSNVNDNFRDDIKTLEAYTLREGEFWTVGIDLGMMKDRTVITVLNEEFEVIYWKRFMLAEQNDVMTLYSNLKAELKYITSKNDDVEIIIENNYERSIIQLLQNNFKIIEHSTQTKTKSTLINKLSLYLQNNLLKIPKRFEQIRKELLAYNYKTTNSGNITYGGDEDDCVISLALCVLFMDRATDYLYETLFEHEDEEEDDTIDIYQV